MHRKPPLFGALLTSSSIWRSHRTNRNRRYTSCWIASLVLLTPEHVNNHVKTSNVTVDCHVTRRNCQNKGTVLRRLTIQACVGQPLESDMDDWISNYYDVPESCGTTTEKICKERGSNLPTQHPAPCSEGDDFRYQPVASSINVNRNYELEAA